MIAVLASITMVLCRIDMYLHNNHHIKCKRRTIQLLHQEYGCLFSRAYQMNYKWFMAIHDLLQQGIKEYITNNNNCTNYTSPNNELSSFHVHNGYIIRDPFSSCLKILCWWLLFGHICITWNQKNRCLSICLGSCTCSKYMCTTTILFSNDNRRM